MDCYCRSKELYSKNQQNKIYQFNGKISDSTRCPIKSNLKPQSSFTKLKEQLLELSQMWMPNQIQQLEYQQIRYNPLRFYKNYVAKNIPCVIKNTIGGDDIIQRWKDYNYLSQVLGDNQITVALTPDGFADSIKSSYFVQPYQQKMTINKFLNYKEKGSGIQYIQNQNNSLVNQFQILEYQYPRDAIKFIGQNVFDVQPDASNFWMGRSESVSSIHKDPYQNLYLCINGEKHFTLIPPIGILNMQEDYYQSGRWVFQQQKFTVKTQGSEVKWISCNPDLKSDYKKFEDLNSIKKFHIVLQQGDLLYLPSLWYHQVSQWNKNPNNYIIAINHWFDMEFTQNHSLYQLSRKIAGF